MRRFRGEGGDDIIFLKRNIFLKNLHTQQSLRELVESFLLGIVWPLPHFQTFFVNLNRQVC